MIGGAGSLIGYLISFALGVYVAVAALLFRKIFYSAGPPTTHEATVALGAACLWPVRGIFRVISLCSGPKRVSTQSPLPEADERPKGDLAETAKVAVQPLPEADDRLKADLAEAAKVAVQQGTEAQQKALYERIRNVDDTDEAYRLCLEFLHSQPLDFGPYASHVPYAEMLRQSVSTAQADGPRMLHMLGLIALTQNDFKTMRRLLDRAVYADPNDAEIHNSLGYGMCRERKFLSASVVLMHATTLRPDLAVAELNLNLARVGLSGGAT